MGHVEREREEKVLGRKRAAISFHVRPASDVRLGIHNTVMKPRTFGFLLLAVM
jgi:hypothetical protein